MSQIAPSGTDVPGMTMPRSRVWRILVDGEGSLATRLAGEVAEAYAVTVNRSPSCGLVMALARDTATNEPFCLGEILVTECTVTIGGHPGYGLVIGERPEIALALAIIDAVWTAGAPELPRWSERLIAEEEAIAAARRRDFAMLEPSRVRFETMEDYK
jgi:alpha-D-ribose 1-methylphosphonate 5-triphosphate synthase subunit PhnG